MSVTWVKGSPSQFIQTPLKAVQSVTENFDMEALVREAAEAMQQTIGTINNTKSGPGRYQSGLMLRSVEWKVELEGSSIVGEFGWLDTQEMYFLYQEEGFTIWNSGVNVPAMFALQDAGLAAQQEFLKRLSQAVKNG